MADMISETFVTSSILCVAVIRASPARAIAPRHPNLFRYSRQRVTAFGLEQDLEPKPYLPIE